MEKEGESKVFKEKDGESKVFKEKDGMRGGGGRYLSWFNHESPIYYWQHCSKRAEN